MRIIKAQDIENLIELAKQKVLDKFGIELKTEIKILGKKSQIYPSSGKINTPTHRASLLVVYIFLVEKSVSVLLI